MPKNLQAFIFDLDGVITDTAEYHFLAWKELANSLNIEFDRESNEELKGISRMESLELILKSGGIDQTFNGEEKLNLATKKNDYYKQLIENITAKDILPGIIELLQNIKQNKLKIGLASASKNAPTVLERLELVDYFDAIVNVAEVKNGKPDPEIFLKAVEMLEVPVEDCVGVEDAEAGVRAIKSANMFAVGVGPESVLHKADLVVSTTKELIYEEIVNKFMNYKAGV